MQRAFYIETGESGQRVIKDDATDEILGYLSIHNKPKTPAEALEQIQRDHSDLFRKGLNPHDNVTFLRAIMRKKAASG